MNSVAGMLAVRDTLRLNLTDPVVTAGGDRDGINWIYTDEPHASNKFPMIELKKIDNPSVPIDIGSDYTEYEQLFVNVWFYTKNGFKVVIDDIEYSNGLLVEYYQGLIKETLKANFNDLCLLGAKMYKHVNTSTIAYNPDTQLYRGAVSIRVAYFNS